MSDLSIPGVSDRYNTSKLINDLMEVEKTKLKRMESNKETMQTEKEVWQGMNRKLDTLRGAARSLTGFDSPFHKKIGQTSDETALQVEASRAAQNGQWEVKIIQKAEGDRFISGNISLDHEVPRGTYSINIGEEEIRFQFRGGKLDRFVSALNERGRNLIRASAIRNTASSQVLLIEGLKEGSENRLVFKDESKDLMIDLGLLQRSQQGERRVELNPNQVENLKGESSELLFENQGMRLRPGQNIKLPISPGLTDTKNMVLEMEVTLSRLDPSEIPVDPGPPGLNLTNPGGIDFQGISLQNAPFLDGLPPGTPSGPPPDNIDMGVISVSDGSSSSPLPELQDITATQKISVPLEVYLSSLQHIELKNDNTYRDIQIANVRVFNPQIQGDVEPVNALANARDAIVELEGVQVMRSSNQIDDLISGLTLNVRKATKEDIEINVEPDAEAIKMGIINLLGNYNEVVAEINILTTQNEAVVNEIPYFTDEDREKAMERLGMFQGDITLNQLRGRLQRIMQDAYPTNDPNLVMLSQIGISTNTSRFGGMDASRLRGYMDLDEGVLDQAISSNVQHVRELFGRDTTGDLIQDSGISILMDENLSPYTQRGGFLPTRISTIDRNLTRTDREISQFNDYLARYELDLRRKYGAMEGALNQMEGTFNAIDNFSRQNSQGN